MKINPQSPETMKCLGRKLELALADPDPMGFRELTLAYNCKGCDNLKLCGKILRVQEVSK